MSTTNAVKEQARASLNTANDTIRRFIRADLPKWISILNEKASTEGHEDNVLTIVEESISEIKATKDVKTVTEERSYSQIDRALVLASVYLWACGYRTAEFAGRMLNKANTGKLLNRAKQFMSAYFLISDLYGAGTHHALSASRAYFRSLFEQLDGVTASAAKRLIFQNIVGQQVSDETYVYFVEGRKFDAEHALAGQWDIKPMVVKYADTLRRDRDNKTNNAETFRTFMTVQAIKDKDAEFVIAQASTEVEIEEAVAA